MFFYLLIINLLLLILIPIRYKTLYRISVLFSGLSILFLVLFYIFNALKFDFFFNTIFYKYYIYNISIFGHTYIYYIIFDNLSLLLMFLTSILYLICIIVIWSISYYYKLLNILLYLVIIFVLLSFMTFDLLIFYIFFEFILIPMVLIIGIWGSRTRKLTAAYRFFLYTILGSVFFLTVIIYLYYFFGTTDIFKLLSIVNLDYNLQILFWFFTFFAFAVKVPIFPVHTWLPEAHAEAPTIGSIILAGILLKLGPYGIFRFSNFLFPFGLVFFKPFIFFISLLGLYYTSLTAVRQLDIKKIIAYSSIGHMALIIIGLTINTLESFIGSFILLLAHGFVSGGLFFLIGCVYERYKTRIILYYNGLIQINPFIGFFFFLYLLGNIAFPGTLNFISEMLILLGISEENLLLLILVALSSIFVLSYNLFLFSKLFLFSENINFSVYAIDLSTREFVVNLIFLFPVFFWGLFPSTLIFFFYKNFLVLNFLYFYFPI